MKMKKITIVIISLSLIVALSSIMTSCGSGQNNNEQSTESHDDSVKLTHVCPMHPDEKGGANDKCSKCGMALEPIAKQVEASCPMHPEITGKKGDTCSKCGMALVAPDNSESE